MARRPVDLEFLLRRVTDGTADDGDRQRLAGYFRQLEVETAAAGADVEHVYANSAVAAAALPESRRPDNAWGYREGGESDGLDWLPAQPSLSEAVPFLLRAERAIAGSPAVGDPVAAEWSDPITIGVHGLREDAFWAPFAYALRYRDREQASAASSSGGTWLARDGADDPIAADALDWSDVAALEFAQADADGLEWSEQLNGVQLGGATIAVGRRDGSERAWVAFDVAEGQTIKAMSDGSLRTFRIEGLSRNAGADVDPADVDPPLDDYEVYLLLPALRGGQGRAGVDGWGTEEIYAASPVQDLPASQHPSDAWPFDEPGMAGGLQWHDGVPDDYGFDNPWLQIAIRRVLGNPLVGRGAVAYEVDGLPDGLRFAEASRRITGSPSAAGTFLATYRASEADTGAEDELRFAVKVVADAGGILGTERLANRHYPRGAAIADFTLPEGTARNGGALAHAADGLPDGLRFDPATRLVSGTPAEAGAFAVTYTVSEAGGGSDSLAFFVRVVESPHLALFGSAAAPNRTLVQGVGIILPYALPEASQRNRHYGPWSEPKAESHFAQDGEDGRGFEHVYASTNLEAIPDAKKPSNDWGYDVGGDSDGLAWTDGRPAASEANPNVFEARRPIVGAPAEGDAVAGEWGDPVLIDRAGVDGADGQDGLGYESIFAVGPWELAAFPAALLPSNEWAFDAGGTAVDPDDSDSTLLWSDAGQSLTRTNRYLYRVRRRIRGVPAAGSPVQVDDGQGGMVANGWIAGPDGSQNVWMAVEIVGVWGDRGLDGVPGFGGKNYAVTMNEQAAATAEAAAGHWAMQAPTGAADALEDVDSWADVRIATRLVVNFLDKDSVDEREAWLNLQVNDIIAPYVSDAQWADLRILTRTPSAHSIEFTLRRIEDRTPEDAPALPANGDVTFYLSRAPVPAAVSAEASLTDHVFRVDKRPRVPVHGDPALPQPSASVVPLSVDAGGPYVTGVGEFLLVNAFAKGGRPPYTFAWPQLGEAEWFTQFGNGFRARYQFDSAGNRGGMVTVTDANGDTNVDMFSVEVGAVPVLFEADIVGPDTMVAGTRAWFASTERGTHRYRGPDTWAWSVVDADDPADGRLVTGTADHGASVHIEAVSAGAFDLRMVVRRGNRVRTVTKRVTVTAAPDPPAPNTVFPYFYAGDAVNGPESTAELRWHRGEELVAVLDAIVRLKPSDPETIEVREVADPNPGLDPVALYWSADGVRGAQEGKVVQLTAVHPHSGVTLAVRWAVEVALSSSEKGQWRIGAQYEQFFGPIAKLTGYTEDGRVEGDGRVQQGDIVLFPWDIPLSSLGQTAVEGAISYIPTMVRFQCREPHTAEVAKQPSVTDAGPQQNQWWNPLLAADSAPQLPTDIGPFEVEASSVVRIQLPEAYGGNAPLTYSIIAGRPAWLFFLAGARQLTGRAPSEPTRAQHVTYQVRDADGQTDLAGFTVEVVGADDAAAAVATTVALYRTVPGRETVPNVAQPSGATVTAAGRVNADSPAVDMEPDYDPLREVLLRSLATVAEPGAVPDGAWSAWRPRNLAHITNDIYTRSAEEPEHPPREDAYEAPGALQAQSVLNEVLSIVGVQGGAYATLTGGNTRAAFLMDTRTPIHGNVGLGWTLPAGATEIYIPVSSTFTRFRGMAMYGANVPFNWGSRNYNHEFTWNMGNVPSLSGPGLPGAEPLKAGSRQFTANWTPAARSAPPIPVRHYLVRHRTAAADGSPAGEWSDPIMSTGAPETVTGLVNGTTYDVQVAAVDATGQGGWRDLGQATPMIQPLPDPGAPLLATGDGGVEAGWSPDVADGDDPEATYAVQVQDQPQQSPPDRWDLREEFDEELGAWRSFVEHHELQGQAPVPGFSDEITGLRLLAAHLDKTTGDSVTLRIEARGEAGVRTGESRTVRVGYSEGGLRMPQGGQWRDAPFPGTLPLWACRQTLKFRADGSAFYFYSRPVRVPEDQEPELDDFPEAWATEIFYPRGTIATTFETKPVGTGALTLTLGQNVSWQCIRPHTSTDAIKPTLANKGAGYWRLYRPVDSLTADEPAPAPEDVPQEAGYGAVAHTLVYGICMPTSGTYRRFDGTVGTDRSANDRSEWAMGSVTEQGYELLPCTWAAALTANRLAFAMVDHAGTDHDQPSAGGDGYHAQLAAAVRLSDDAHVTIEGGGRWVKFRIESIHIPLGQLGRGGDRCAMNVRPVGKSHDAFAAELEIPSPVNFRFTVAPASAA